MKGEVTFESYGNGRLSAWMWWGGVDCYLREIKQDPPRHSVLPALKAAGTPSHSAFHHRTEGEGLENDVGAGIIWPLSALYVRQERARADWMADHSAFQSASTYLCLSPPAKKINKNAFIFRKALLWAFMMCVITEESERDMCISIVQTFYFPSAIRMRATDGQQSGKRCPCSP